jgi:hypothetical protein
MDSDLYLVQNSREELCGFPSQAYADDTIWFGETDNAILQLCQILNDFITVFPSL